MKSYINPPVRTWGAICSRPAIADAELDAMIAPLFAEVQKKGDVAVKAYTRKFDQAALSTQGVSKEQVQRYAKGVAGPLRQAIDTAYANIRRFHKAQMSADKVEPTETQSGVLCWRERRAIEKVGLYVPGGSAPLISTVLMLGVPAQLAGCKEVVLCTPPSRDGSINPAICYAAELVGATTVVKAGGAQAIAAMTFGTKTIPKVDKVFGPGNQYVTAAKKYAGEFGVAMDIPAGPSEVMVLADDSARADFVAADLLSQAEHGPDSQVAFVAANTRIVEAVQAEIGKQIALLPRKDIAKQALKNSFSVTFSKRGDMLAFANTYAPEHLILSVARPEEAAAQVVNAGSVFLGNYTPESAGDYASGTNHTLPTNGWARSYGGVSVDSFCKYVSFQSITPEGLATLGPTITLLADAEGLDGHARAVTTRTAKD